MQAGHEIVGFYHSHPDHPALWSATDLADAHWPGCSYVIISVENRRAVRTNSFLLLGQDEAKRFEDGLAGTLVGGWLAQRWLRTNYRALYLLSFWSVALTLPCGALVFFGPRAWTVPALFAAEFFLFLNTGPLNAAIVNSVSAPVRATAISMNLFFIHFFGDTFSPQIIGAISDHTKSLRLGLGATLVFLVFSAVILRTGARFAPPLEETA